MGAPAKEGKPANVTAAPMAMRTKGLMNPPRTAAVGLTTTLYIEIPVSKSRYAGVNALCPGIDPAFR